MVHFSSRSAAGATLLVTPNVSVIVSERTTETEPTGRSTGMTNQSSPYSSAKSASRNRPTSPALELSAPRLTLESSNAQYLLAGCPE